MKKKLFILLYIISLLFTVGCSKENKNYEEFLQDEKEYIEIGGNQKNDLNEKSYIFAFKSVLSGEKEFINTDKNNELVYLNNFRYWSDEERDYAITPIKFATLDMDGDSYDEIVIELASSSDGYIEVLKYDNEKVYGYQYGYRSLKWLKEDGTFNGSSGAADNSFNKLIYEDGRYEIDTLAYSETSTESWKIVYYYINNKEVTAKEFQEYCVVQDNKEDTEWYEFTLENIETYVK